MSKQTRPAPYETSVAQPRRMGFEGTYTGAELATRSSRPGAYDAMAIPSLFNGKKRASSPMPEPAPASAVPAPCSVRPFVVTNDAPPLPPLPVEAGVDTTAAEAELETRKATVELWQAYVEHLRARMAFDALARRMRPFLPPHNMPAL